MPSDHEKLSSIPHEGPLKGVDISEFPNIVGLLPKEINHFRPRITEDAVVLWINRSLSAGKIPDEELELYERDALKCEGTRFNVKDRTSCVPDVTDLQTYTAIDIHTRVPQSSYGSFRWWRN
jgi:hypothetical protein